LPNKGDIDFWLVQSRSLLISFYLDYSRLNDDLGMDLRLINSLLTDFSFGNFPVDGRVGGNA